MNGLQENKGNVNLFSQIRYINQAGHNIKSLKNIKYKIYKYKYKSKSVIYKKQDE